MAKLLYDRLPEVVQQDGLAIDLESASLLHDMGKAAIGFQDTLRGLRPNWNGWRHEVLSAAFASILPVPEEVVFAVLTHHKQIPGSPTGEERGRLRWNHSEDLPEDWLSLLAEWQPNEAEALELWNSLCAHSRREDLRPEGGAKLAKIALNAAWLDDLKLRQYGNIPSERRVRASLLRGLLMGADHLASGGVTELPPVIRLGTFQPRFALRGFQQACAVRGNVILDAPTGSGKTEAAILWAATNQSKNGRFFYTLPYTAALNAMHARLQREFPEEAGSIGLLHGRAAHHLFEAAQRDYPSDPQKATQEALARARLAKETLYPVRVCTPHQLLRFGLRGKGWEQMLSEVPGSCVVFDEVHSYDARLAGLTLGTARLFAELGAKLMFISATLPRFMRENLRRIAPMLELSPDPADEGDRKVLDRKRHVVALLDGTLMGCVPRIVEAARQGLHVLVVCNHVSSAQSIAAVLRSKLGDNEEMVCLFHGRFNMKDRKSKEAALSGKELPRVLVATQVVEVSLDISFDLGFFEPAPIDALVQRMGRVNRQGDAPAPVSIVRSALSDYRIYSKGLVDATMNLLAARTDPLSESDLTHVCDAVYCNGYVGEDKTDFESRFNHSYLRDFSDALVAGEHHQWIEKVIENQSGRADVLPLSLKTEHRQLQDEKRWLEADALLVNAYTSSFGSLLDKSGDPWTVDLAYDSKNGLRRPGK
jgi:CRISPR-associated endonuclease/helicase Cas3